MAPSGYPVATRASTGWAPGQGHSRGPVALGRTALEPRHLHRRVRPHPVNCSQRPAKRKCAATPGSILLQRQGPLQLLWRRHPEGEMNFLPDVYVPCETCPASATTAETLEVHYKGKTATLLEILIVEEAAEFFAASTCAPPEHPRGCGPGLHSPNHPLRE